MNSNRHTAKKTTVLPQTGTVARASADPGKTAGQRNKVILTSLGALSSDIQTMMIIGLALYKAGLLTRPDAEGRSLVSEGGHVGYILGTEDGKTGPLAVGIINDNPGAKSIALNANGYLTTPKERPMKGGYVTEEDPEMPDEGLRLLGEVGEFQKRISACIERIALRS